MEETIEIPEGVKIDVSDMKVVVKGAKTTMERDFDDPRFNALIKMSVNGSKLTIKADDESRKVKAMVGTMRAHINNIIGGTTHGYKYMLKIVYTHFPMTITVEKNEVHIKNFLGEKGARIAKIKGDAKIMIDKENVTVTGYNKEDVSQTAANIERACKLRGRDRRIFQDGVYMSTKERGM